MADTKITALTALTAADPANDVIPIVDVSDTTMAASGTTKKISVNNILSSSPTASGALTVTGLVTAGSASITGDLTVDTSTLKVDSTNNRVGIGTATPSAPLSVRFDNAGVATVALFENQLTDFASSAAGQIVVGARGYNNTVLRQNPDIGTSPAIGSTLDTILANTYVGVGNGRLILATQSTARLSVHESSGDVSIANGNVVMATSGKGIDFSATTSGSGTMTSELLNDYEEGTWVPTDGSGAGLAFTVSACRYTKVGRLVTVQGSVTYPATASGSNAIWGGFPFVAADNIFLTIGYTDTPIATFTYFSGTNNGVYLLTPGVNTINSSLSLKTITFFGTYMV
jgi:hypothetical protein